MRTREHRVPPIGSLRAGVLLAAITACLAAAAVHADDGAMRTVDETARTRAAVIAVDQHWSVAEIGGDAAWVNRMLLPGYRSIGPDGKAHSKAAIVAGAAKHHSHNPQREFEAYVKAHPYGTSVALRGNVAILSFYDPKLGPQQGVMSSDIFLYVDGHWHALYSQHSMAGKK